MRQTLLISLLIIFLILGFLSYQNKVSGNKLSVHPSQITTHSTSIETPKPLIGIPSKITIPKIQVEADIEPVGLDAKRNMDVPSKAENVGWYKLGAKPGEVGNAVIDGHLDRISGAPAVFYDLKQLQKGDEIIVQDDKNQKYTYRITDIQKYDYDKFPLQEVFGSTNKSRLNLITCDGIFDKSAKNYSQRMVVYSELE